MVVAHPNRHRHVERLAVLDVPLGEEEGRVVRGGQGDEEAVEEGPLPGKGGERRRKKGGGGSRRRRRRRRN